LLQTEVISALPSLLALKDIIVTQVIDRILGTRPGINASSSSPLRSAEVTAQRGSFLVLNPLFAGALANIGASALSPSELLVVLHAPNIPAKVRDGRPRAP